MKHLKTYKIFESYIKHDIDDILLELEDEGFTTTVTNRFIRIWKHNTRFKYVEIEDVVERLMNFLDDKFKKITIVSRNTDYYTFPRPAKKVPFWKWVDKKPPEIEEPKIIDINKIIPESVKKWIDITDIKIEYKYPGVYLPDLTIF